LRADKKKLKRKKAPWTGLKKGENNICCLFAKRGGSIGGKSVPALPNKGSKGGDPLAATRKLERLLGLCAKRERSEH